MDNELVDLIKYSNDLYENAEELAGRIKDAGYTKNPFRWHLFKEEKPTHPGNYLVWPLQHKPKNSIIMQYRDEDFLICGIKAYSNNEIFAWAEIPEGELLKI